MQQCPRGPRAQVISVSPRGDSSVPRSVRCLRALLNIHHAKVRKTEILCFVVLTKRTQFLFLISFSPQL